MSAQIFDPPPPFDEEHDHLNPYDCWCVAELVYTLATGQELWFHRHIDEPGHPDFMDVAEEIIEAAFDEAYPEEKESQHE